MRLFLLLKNSSDENILLIRGSLVHFLAALSLIKRSWFHFLVVLRFLRISYVPDFSNLGKISKRLAVASDPSAIALVM